MSGARGRIVIEMAVWAYMMIEKSSPEDIEAGLHEFEYKHIYNIFQETFDVLDDVIDFIKKDEPGLCLEKDTEIINRMEMLPPDENAIFRCWNEGYPDECVYIGLLQISCWCRHCQCDAPATQLDLNGNPRCDDCKEISVNIYKRLCLRQTKKGKRCPTCGDDIRWEVFREIYESKTATYRIDAGSCGCERREWRRSLGPYREEPSLAVEELPVLEWEEVSPQDRDPEGSTDKEWRSGFPLAEKYCSHGVLYRHFLGFELVHFPLDSGSTDEQNWCLRVHKEWLTPVSYRVGSREEGELLASRIKAWGYDDSWGYDWFLQQDDG